MRNYRRRRPSYKAHANNSFWLSFSDLMSALVLVFVLVLFYAIYQYTTTVDDLFYTESKLTVQSEELRSRLAELDDKNAELAVASAELEASREELTTEQKRLALTMLQNEEAQAQLAQQEEELKNALTLLDDQQAQIDAQRAAMDQQQEEFNLQLQQMAGQQQQLEALVGVRARIIASLGQALKDANISATVDSSGSIRISESVMFDFGSSVLKESGKEMLDRFMPVYFAVLFSDENVNSVSEILIEGHTDNVGTYQSNLRLSQERTLAVMNYIMSQENTSISQEMKDRFSAKVSAVGRSFSDPVIVNESTGEIDADASRRVEFKFRMQDVQMVEAMQQILESMQAPQAETPPETAPDAPAEQQEAPPEQDTPPDTQDVPPEVLEAPPEG